MNPLRGQNNVQGSCDMGSFPHEFSGYRHVSDDATREIVRAPVGRAAQRRAGPAHPQHDGRGRSTARSRASICRARTSPSPTRTPSTSRRACARWNASSCRTSSSTRPRATPMSSCPAPRSSKRTAPSPTPSGASAACARRSSRSPARRTGRRRSRSPRRWACRCATRHPGEIMDEIAATTPTFRGVSYARLDELGSIQWPCNDSAPAGTPIMHVERFVRGKGQFMLTEYVATRGARRPALPAAADDRAHSLAIQCRRADAAHRQHDLARRGRARDPSVRRRAARRAATATSSRCRAARARSRCAPGSASGCSRASSIRPSIMPSPAPMW